MARREEACEIGSSSSPNGGGGWTASPQGNQSPNPWGYPPGGFVNLLHYQPPPPLAGQNFHFVGQTHNFNPTSPPPPPSATQAPSKKRKVSTNVDDDGVEASRAAKKRHWTHEEEVRLASSWLNISNDPIKGNEKKGDTFWGEITSEFNKNSPLGHKTRDSNQLKIHWTRLKTIINDFHGCWTTVCKVQKSGYSDDQLEDDAMKMYEQQHKKPFKLLHWWRKLKDQPKWCAQLEKDKNKSMPIDVITDEDKDGERPIGREAAKAQRNGKRKAESVMDGIVLLGENINKIAEVQQGRKEEREKVTQAQLEMSRLQFKAAKEQKETKLLEVYNSLLRQDTSQMTEQAKAQRDKALERIELKLFADDTEN